MSLISTCMGSVATVRSLSTKLTLLVLLPSLVLALVTVGGQRFLEDVGYQATDDLIRTHKESRELSAATRSIRLQVDAFTRTLTHYLDRHENALLSAEPHAQDAWIAMLNVQASNLADLAVDALEPMRSSFLESVETEIVDDEVLTRFDRRYTYIVRTASNLPRLLAILADSHRRTEGHLIRGEFDRARSQYVHEEQARARALRDVTERLTSVLDDLAVDVESYIALEASAALARARTDAGNAINMTFWWIAATIVLSTSTAVVVIRLIVSRPIGDVVAAMLRLAKGDLDVDIKGLWRRDEIGVIARALDVFKEGAAERRRIERDLAEHRDHLEELVETRTREIEDQKVQIEEALDRERELSGLQRQFVAMVSHEFRTPLAVIDGHAQRLLRRLDTIRKEQLDKGLKTVRLSVHRLVDLMDSVLAAARLENGQIQIDPKPCSLIDLVHDVSGSYLDLHPNRRIHRDLDRLPAMVTADEKLIRQVVSNVISNAIKYSPNGADISIEGSVDDQGRATVAIRDRGLGIPLAEQDKLFERFFRASTSTGIAGTGIGLNLAFHLVQMHGGVMDFVSAEGEGTTFFIRLPIGGPTSAAVHADTERDDATTANDDRGPVETLAS